MGAVQLTECLYTSRMHMCDCDGLYSGGSNVNGEER